jgi:hypothetical protein
MCRVCMSKPDDDLHLRIGYGIRRGAARALAEHKKNGRSIVIWRDGRVVRIPPEEIQVNEAYLLPYPNEFSQT